MAGRWPALCTLRQAPPRRAEIGSLLRGAARARCPHDAVDARKGVPDFNAVQPHALSEVWLARSDGEAITARQPTGSRREGCAMNFPAYKTLLATTGESALSDGYGACGSGKRVGVTRVP